MSSMPSYASPSLYVGDLSSEMTEGMLFEIFNQIGPVASIRVCRDAVTRRSLGYAYVNFHSVVDAERALEQLNNTNLKGKRCRIMWSQRDPSMRKSGSGNIFIKNLDKSIDHKTLYDTFSVFGNILSCKVGTDPATGESKGYGFVHYDSEEAAKQAIEKVNNMMLADQQVHVAPFKPRAEREASAAGRFTNLYVKNFPDDCQSKEALTKLFSECGTVTSVFMPTRKTTKAALAIEQAEAAVRKAKRTAAKAAADAAALADDDDAKTAAEAAAKAAKEAVEKAEAEAAEKKKAAADDKKADGDAEQLEVPRGYGFVNYETPEQAAKAVETLNGKDCNRADGALLFVGRAQKKSEREAAMRKQAEQRKQERISKYQGVNLYVKNLEDTVDEDKLREEFAPYGTITSCRVMTNEKGNSRGFGFVCFSTPEEATRAVTEMNGKMFGSKPVYVALAQPKEVRRAQLQMQHQHQRRPVKQAGAPAPVSGMYAPGAPVFYAAPPNAGGAPGQPGFVYPPQMMRGAGPQQMRRGVPPQAAAAQQQAAAAQQQQQQQQQQQANGGAAGTKDTVQATMHAIAAAPLDAKRIAELPIDQQKMVLGEKLYPLIAAPEPQLAGKITGMLLDSYFSEEIIHLIETPDALAAKIEEAKNVLKKHRQQQQQRKK